MSTIIANSTPVLVPSTWLSQKLRTGSFFPDWLLERRTRTERALTTVVASCYLKGVSTRRMNDLVATLGISNLSKSQVSDMAKELDTMVDEFRTRRLDQGPYFYLSCDALTMKVREGGRVVKTSVLIAIGVNNDGYRELLGMQVATSESVESWTGFFQDLKARGLGEVYLVTSDAHIRIQAAVAQVLPTASWQRWATHFAKNLSSKSLTAWLDNLCLGWFIPYSSTPTLGPPGARQGKLSSFVTSVSPRLQTFWKSPWRRFSRLPAHRKRCG